MPHQRLGHLSSLLCWIVWTYIMLLDLLRVGHVVVRIVSCLLDLVYPSSGLASIGLWQRRVRRWWKIGLASSLVSSYTFHGTRRKLWWISLRRVLCP